MSMAVPAAAGWGCAVAASSRTPSQVACAAADRPAALLIIMIHTVVGVRHQLDLHGRMVYPYISDL